MPNYVTSTVHIFGPADEIDRFKNAIITIAPTEHSDAGGMLFDFNAVIPMPAIISATQSSSMAEEGAALIIARGSGPAPFADLGLYESQIQRIRAESGLELNEPIAAVAAAFLAKFPDWETAGMNRLKAVVETGYTDWYAWSIEKWGTKWGAFRFAETPSETGYSFRFETAWSFPMPIFAKLAADFPLLQFQCATFDEGWNFAGIGWFNRPFGQPEFAFVKATNELYELVYGHKPPEDDDDEAEF